MSEALNFQSMILALHHFWAEHGCLIWHPYYSQVGAGTMNPSTFLRVLGPEPFNVGYVEPSVRPDDGRYGDNPNRLQMFYQYQLILKPDPGNPQELYLQSLEAIGIDPKKHDIRFVEDNWESPALGAWGLGWEVWLDGLEITQFTYFQQAGRQELDPISVEITYGLDRIAAPLQGARHFKDIQWNADRTFGDMNLQGEQEQSKYYFEIADVERTRELYRLHEEELNAALDAGLIIPAYDHLLRLSHLFNVLDTRGAVGVTERQQFFRQMRGMAGRVSEMYLADRERQEYPWGYAASDEMAKQAPAAPQVSLAPPESPADFVLEIGVEELPPGDLDQYMQQLAEALPALLNDLRLEHGEIRVMGTPRRLVAHVKDLAPRQPDIEALHKGPPAARAFDTTGQPTKAAEGFARGKGVEVSSLVVEEIDGGEYVVARVQEIGVSATEALSARLADLVANLKVDRTMRWNHSNMTFSRPIRWLLALHGSQVVPFSYAGYHSANITRGLRFGAASEAQVADTGAYFKLLGSEGIVVDPAARQQAVMEQVQKIAQEAGGEIKLDQALLDEVTHLVEAPVAVLGTFDEERLKLPREVLVSVMKKHQRYFPVYQGDDLLPHFVTVSNGAKEDMSLVAAGNEAVVRARFADAAFFVEEDLKKPLPDYLEVLGTLTFQADLGSMLDKTKRITQLVDSVAEQLQADAGQVEVARRAAELAKADLATNMVVEMTSLQGVMGQQYAEQAGESSEVALAIFEHYLPRSGGDIAPSGLPGLIVGLADRLDSLAGLFAAGLAPTGTKDPFALRRAAIGLAQALISWNLDFDIREGLFAAGSLLPIEASSDKLAECAEFMVGRMRSLFSDQNYRYDVVEAVLAAQGHNPAGAQRAVDQLAQWVVKEDWTATLDAYARCVRITRDKTETFTINPTKFEADEEKALFNAIQKLPQSYVSVDDFLNNFVTLIPAITAFFDGVLVMAEDQEVQNNRLALLQEIAGMADGLADLSQLEGF